MKQLIIVGAGDSGQEVYAWASSHFASMGLSFKGFLDDEKPDVLARIMDYQPQNDDVFVCSIASPAARVKCSDILRAKGAVFINLIHPSAVILSAITATGIVIAPFVYVGNRVQLFDDVFVNTLSSVGHDVVIKRGSILCAHVDLTGHVVLGERVLLGSSSCVIPCKTIGDGSIVGAGSAVVRDVPAGETVFGVPAKRLM